VTVGKEEKVFALAFHFEIRIMVELIEVQGDEKFSAAKRCARVTGLNGVNHSQHISSELSTDFLELFN
jgi:hypothetical protein